MQGCASVVSIIHTKLTFYSTCFPKFKKKFLSIKLENVVDIKRNITALIYTYKKRNFKPVLTNGKLT